MIGWVGHVCQGAEVLEPEHQGYALWVSCDLAITTHTPSDTAWWTVPSCSTLLLQLRTSCIEGRYVVEHNDVVRALLQRSCGGRD